MKLLLSFTFTLFYSYAFAQEHNYEDFRNLVLSTDIEDREIFLRVLDQYTDVAERDKQIEALLEAYEEQLFISSQIDTAKTYELASGYRFLKDNVNNIDTIKIWTNKQYAPDVSYQKLGREWIKLRDNLNDYGVMHLNSDTSRYVETAIYSVFESDYRALLSIGYRDSINQSYLNDLQVRTEQLDFLIANYKAKAYSPTVAVNLYPTDSNGDTLSYLMFKMYIGDQEISPLYSSRSWPAKVQNVSIAKWYTIKCYRGKEMIYETKRIFARPTDESGIVNEHIAIDSVH